MLPLVPPTGSTDTSAASLVQDQKDDSAEGLARRVPKKTRTKGAAKETNPKKSKAVKEASPKDSKEAKGKSKKEQRL